MHGGDHPVELGQQVVRVVGRAVEVDVGLRADQQPEAVQRGVDLAAVLDHLPTVIPGPASSAVGPLPDTPGPARRGVYSPAITKEVLG